MTELAEGAAATAGRHDAMCFTMSENGRAEEAQCGGGQPLPIAASVWHDGALTLRLAGAVAACALRVRRSAARRWPMRGLLAVDPRTDASLLRRRKGVRYPLWRLSVASVAPPICCSGPTLIEWGGALRWLRGDQAPEQVRNLAASAGGHATLFRGETALKMAAGVFQPLSPVLAKIHRNLKQAFDPAGVFNRGRMYPNSERPDHANQSRRFHQGYAGRP